MPGPRTVSGAGAAAQGPQQVGFPSQEGLQVRPGLFLELQPHSHLGSQEWARGPSSRWRLCLPGIGGRLGYLQGVGLLLTQPHSRRIWTIVLLRMDSLCSSLGPSDLGVFPRPTAGPGLPRGDFAQLWLIRHLQPHQGRSDLGRVTRVLRTAIEVTATRSAWSCL